MTLVSIITPSYNQAPYLEMTIRSVLAQDYPKIEYLIVDGASTDGSQEIIRRYADRLSWWVSEPDSGQAEAINKGLQRAQGEIIAWLNSDDFYLPGAVRQAVAALQAAPEAGMAFGEALTVDATGRPLKRLVFGDWGLEDFLRFRIICQPAVFMRRSVLEKAGFLDASYHLMLDHQLWIRLAQQAPAIRIHDQSRQGVPLLAAARQHPQAKNSAQAERFAVEIMQLLHWIKSEPALRPQFERDQRRIRGGAYRLAGRYLLDGGRATAALRCYGQALVQWPSYTLQHWRRILFALACLPDGGRLASSLRRHLTSPQAVTRLSQELRQQPELAGWPGLDLGLAPQQPVTP